MTTGQPRAMIQMIQSWLPLALVVLALGGALVGCAEVAPVHAAVAGSAPGCVAGDQDRYVYDPRRLQVLRPCARMSGVVEAIETDADGDMVFSVRPDPPYQGLLTAANRRYEQGDLIVEAVCTSQPLQPNVLVPCAGDADPYAGPFPAIGAHVLMEGRYVLDLHHEGHAELHPLYRTKVIAP